MALTGRPYSIISNYYLLLTIYFLLIPHSSLPLFAPPILRSAPWASPRHTQDRHNYGPQERRSACNTGSRWNAARQELPLLSPPHGSPRVYGSARHPKP